MKRDFRVKFFLKFAAKVAAYNSCVVSINLYTDEHCARALLVAHAARHAAATPLAPRAQPALPARSRRRRGSLPWVRINNHHYTLDDRNSRLKRKIFTIQGRRNRHDGHDTETGVVRGGRGAHRAPYRSSAPCWSASTCRIK